MLTRQEKEKMVLEQYNQGKTIRDIAKELRMSFRDIGAILKKSSAEENENGQTADKMEKHPPLSISAQSYNLFSEGKTPVEVAISLNLTQQEVTHFYREYWNLKKLQCLNKIYEDLGDDIGQFLKLYALCNSAGFDKKHVIELLKMSDDNLQGFEYRYKLLKEEADDLEHKKYTLQKNIRNLEEEISALKKIQNYYQRTSNHESRKLSVLQTKRSQLANLVKRFEEDNKEYTKIKRSVEEKVNSALTDKKALLQLALASLTDTIKSQPDMYSNLLVISSKPTGAPPFEQNYSSPSINGQSHDFQDRYVETYKSMVIDEAEKLYGKMVKDLVTMIMRDLTSANGPPATVRKII
jgi:predicted transcriptional regulator